ncbi:7505_t:CDS:2, partial [Dentiscutata erythropus]
DLQSFKCAHSYDHHKDKVQQVEWHFIEPTIMLTASFDKTAVVFNSRSPKNVASWNLGNTDPECVRWDPFSPQYFYVSTESGLVLCFNARNSNKIAPDMKPTIVASRDLGVEKVFSAQFCLDLPFHLAVAGSEGNVRIWD